MPVNKDDHLSVVIVHTGSSSVIERGILLGEEIEITAAPTAAPTPVLPGVFIATSINDTSSGSAAIEDVEIDGDGLFTTYNMPAGKDFDETVYQQFNFNIKLTALPEQALIRINHSEFNNAKGVRIRIWEQDAMTWHDEMINKTAAWRLEDVDVSSYIDSFTDINNLKVRYESYTTAANKISKIEYVAVVVS